MAVNARDTAIQIKTHVMNVGTEKGGFQAFLLGLPVNVRFTEADVTAIAEELDKIMPFALGVHYWGAMFVEVLGDRMVETVPGIPPKRTGLFADIPTWGRIALALGCLFILNSLGLFGGDRS